MLISSFSAAHKGGCGGCPIKTACTGAQVGQGCVEKSSYISVLKKKKNRDKKRGEGCKK